MERSRFSFETHCTTRIKNWDRNQFLQSVGVCGLDGEVCGVILAAEKSPERKEENVGAGVSKICLLC